MNNGRLTFIDKITGFIDEIIFINKLLNSKNKFSFLEVNTRDEIYKISYDKISLYMQNTNIVVYIIIENDIIKEKIISICHEYCNYNFRGYSKLFVIEDIKYNEIEFIKKLILISCNGELKLN